MGVVRFVSVLTSFVLFLIAQAQNIHELDDYDDFYSELRTQLSTNASLILPTDPLMDEASIRWQAYQRPTYSAVVEVAIEEDVQVTVSNRP